MLNGEQIHANKLATIIFLYLLFHCLKLLFRLFMVYLLARSLVILALLHVRCAISLLSILLLLLLLMVFFCCCCLVRSQLSMCGVIVGAVLSCEYLLFITIYVTLCFSKFIYFVQSITKARISIRHSNCVCIVFICILYYSPCGSSKHLLWNETQ